MQGTGFILGATGFIGQKLAFHFASKGWNLFLSGKNDIALNELAVKIKRKYTIEVKTLCIDIQNISLEKLKANLDLYKNDLKFFINVSGTQFPISKFSECDFDDWEKSVKINFIQPALLTYYFLNIFKMNNEGVIILFSGGGATNSRPNFSSYAASKTALVRLVEIIADELNSSKIRINALAPGIMPSKMQEEILRLSSFLSNNEISRAKKSLLQDDFNENKILELCDYLISDSSRGISGRLISAEWDRWRDWSKDENFTLKKEIFTLRRLTENEN